MRSISLAGSLGLIVVGIAHATSVALDVAGTEVLAFRPIRASMLALALIVSCLWSTDSRIRRPAMIDLAVIGAGLMALWHVAAGPDAMAIPALLRPWMGVLGCAALLMATSRLRSPWLAMTGLLAVAHAAILRLGPDLSLSALIDSARDVGEIHWFGPDDGALGWVFATLSSWALPFFLLGGLIAGRTPIGLSDHAEGHPGRLASSIRAVCRFLMPPLVIGSLLMLRRPGIDPIAILPVLFASIGVGVVWFWFVPAKGAQNRRPTSMLGSLAETGVAFGRLLVLAGAIGMVLAALDRSGLPLDIAQSLAGGFGEAWLPLFLFAAILAAGFGLVMPGIAAYPVAVALLAPALRTVGLDISTIHLLVLSVSAIVSAIVMAQAASGSERRRSIGSAFFRNAASR